MLPPLPTLLADLVRRPSVNPMGRGDIPADWCHESRVTDYLEAHLKALGVAFARRPVARGRDNLVATFRPANATTHLLFEAHQDTVPTDGMTIDPFAGTVRDGKLYGRGACDVKAGVAVMLTAFARLVKENPPHAAAVTVAFTVDEEHTFLGVQELAKDITADFVVVAEPTLLNVVIAHKGVARVRLETSGRACHSSRPQDGVNAVYKMARLLPLVERYAEELRLGPPHPTLGPPTLSVGRIEGGMSSNTVPDFCLADLDRRMLPGETAEMAADAIRAALAGHEFALDVSFACPPLPPAAENHPLLVQLEAAIAGVVGPTSRLAVPYGTDASTLAAAGLPCVVFGPGDIAQAHTKDEWIDLRQVEQAAEILYRFALNASMGHATRSE